MKAPGSVPSTIAHEISGELVQPFPNVVPKHGGVAANDVSPQ
jgi:hypothetical protein